MPSTPTLIVSSVAFNQANWDAPANNNFAAIRAFLMDGGTVIRPVFRVAGSNTDPARYLNLNALNPANFEGCMVWVKDVPGDAGHGGATQKAYAYSDGTTWRWHHNDVGVTIG